MHKWVSRKDMLKATRGDLNANFRFLFWPPLVALTIWAEPSQTHGTTIGLLQYK